MRFLTWCLAWLLYALGDVACKIMTLNDDSERWVEFWYPIYNRLMIMSGNVQDTVADAKESWPWGEHHR